MRTRCFTPMPPLADGWNHTGEVSPYFFTPLTEVRILEVKFTPDSFAGEVRLLVGSGEKRAVLTERVLTANLPEIPGFEKVFSNPLSGFASVPWQKEVQDAVRSFRIEKGMTRTRLSVLKAARPH